MRLTHHSLIFVALLTVGIQQSVFAFDHDEDPSNEIELSSEEAAILRELEREGGFGKVRDIPLLDIYGFADVLVGGFIGMNDHVASQNNFGERITNVMLGNLNMYLDANLTHGFRFLGEIRFHTAPTATSEGPNFDGTADHFVHSTSWDAVDGNTPFSFGYIEIERAYLEYVYANWLKVKIGILLTPYGVWNVDHGSPVIIPTRRPFVVASELIPERQTGLEVSGLLSAGTLRIGYHAYTSNGRGSVSTALDLDDNLAVGGRLYIDTTALGRLRVGGSFYSGTTAEERVNVVPESLQTGSPELSSYFSIRNHELAFGADLVWKIAGFHLQAELLSRQVVYDNDARAPTLGGSTPDYHAWGAYGLLAYELPFWHLRPFFLAEHNDFGRADFGGLSGMTIFFIGLNIRVLPVVVFKAQYLHVKLSSNTGSSSVTDPQNGFEMQCSWAF
ncbi:MAG: hypothetical protein KTR25_13150 [Myxococcales bacterium]|nr:hypothetical protein [Myxococcales bacterium]